MKEVKKMGIIKRERVDNKYVPGLQIWAHVVCKEEPYEGDVALVAEKVVALTIKIDGEAEAITIPVNIPMLLCQEGKSHE